MMRIIGDRSRWDRCTFNTSKQCNENGALIVIVIKTNFKSTTAPKTAGLTAVIKCTTNNKRDDVRYIEWGGER